MTDAIVCLETTKAGDPLTTPDGVAVIATSNAQDVGGSWMAYVRPIVREDELRRLLAANGFGNAWDSTLSLVQKLWAAYWKLKSGAEPQRKRKALAGEFVKQEVATST